ncbi:MAG: hypothetical protein IT528_05890, partial [Nitrosomonas sp.]|nr:hypothetical protein [Nitrosomonas sp.]
ASFDDDFIKTKPSKEFKTLKTQHLKKLKARHLNVQLGPRPFFLVDDMDESPLKTKLLSCSEGPFKASSFSIGHRGAALQFPEHTRESYLAAAIHNATCIRPRTFLPSPNWPRNVPSHLLPLKLTLLPVKSSGQHQPNAALATSRLPNSKPFLEKWMQVIVQQPPYSSFWKAQPHGERISMLTRVQFFLTGKASRYLNLWVPK